MTTRYESIEVGSKVNGCGDDGGDTTLKWIPLKLLCYPIETVHHKHTVTCARNIAMELPSQMNSIESKTMHSYVLSHYRKHTGSIIMQRGGGGGVSL